MDPRMALAAIAREQVRLSGAVRPGISLDELLGTLMMLGIVCGAALMRYEPKYAAVILDAIAADERKDGIQSDDRAEAARIVRAFRIEVPA